MSLKWRGILGFLVVVGILIKVAPNFFPASAYVTDKDGKQVLNDKNQPILKFWWPASGKLVKGLDIQGGVHLVMGVDTDAVMKEKLNRVVRSLNDEFTTNEIKVKEVVPTDYSKYELRITAESPAEIQKITDLIEKNHRGMLQVLGTQGAEVSAKIYDAQAIEMRKQVLDQAINVIRNRIDEFGVAEPSISAQGDNRVLVQLPGIQDSVRAKELINRTARLEFKIVDTDSVREKSLDLNKMITDAETKGNYSLGRDDLKYPAYIKKINADLKEQLPENTQISFEKQPQAKSLEAGKIPILLRTDTNIGGDLLEDAFVSYGQNGEPQVAFHFGVEGARRFGDLTEKNVGKLLAIVLDDTVQSAPVIQSKISDQGVINLNRGNMDETFKEAQMIAMTLRAGALPAALEQLEERTVGATLGADAIAKANLAGMIAFCLIAIFMIVLYGWLGVVATAALALNVICLLAVLTGLGATLTLPGVAGIILTMGMAVDSNVIIFERIKEEFRKGSSWKLAVADGFSHAYSAIIDSNLIGAAVALVLYYYGTGPVRGFAVTLVSGIATSMFTAVFLSRVIIEILGDKVHWKRSAA